ncbi:hypothetical protein [Nostoc sp. ChiQUE01b]|uniref:hypothetical protein n=1 Tax=Nostoc sp. ChiQUE01b TaxID=3075376 RepID=UPI002AD565EA|nr:hypothetical protein [Nostoc sp. ChiQUE01b]MDZ8260702.1 hypothetical protein [Nostoc sp. ChiQUE01b]
MLSLHQHFQRIKEIVDWSWTLAILCMVGYITLGQLAQLYWAMVVFGGLAGSFGLFYEFSCEKLADLNAIEDTYKLQKVIATSALAQDLLAKFAHRNPDIRNQFPGFDQLRYKVNNIRATSAAKFKQRVNQQTKTPSQSSSQPPYQKPVQSTPPYAPPKREAQPPLKKATQPPYQKPAQPTPSYAPPKREAQPPLKKATQRKITLEEYGKILNQSDYEYVKAHPRNGHWVRGYYRRKRKR